MLLAQHIFRDTSIYKLNTNSIFLFPIELPSFCSPFPSPELLLQTVHGKLINVCRGKYDFDRSPIRFAINKRIDQYYMCNVYNLPFHWNTLYRQYIHEIKRIETSINFLNRVNLTFPHINLNHHAKY